MKLPSQRRIVHQRTYLSVPLGTLDAVDDLLSMDLEFMLFVHARTREDVTVYLRDDGRFGLLFPERSPLADEDDLVVPKPSRYPGVLELTRRGSRWTSSITAFSTSSTPTTSAGR